MCTPRATLPYFLNRSFILAALNILDPFGFVSESLPIVVPTQIKEAKSKVQSTPYLGQLCTPRQSLTRKMFIFLLSQRIIHGMEMRFRNVSLSQVSDEHYTFCITFAYAAPAHLQRIILIFDFEFLMPRKIGIVEYICRSAMFAQVPRVPTTLGGAGKAVLMPSYLHIDSVTNVTRPVCRNCCASRHRAGLAEPAKNVSCKGRKPVVACSGSGAVVTGSSVIDNEDEARILSEVTRRIKNLGRKGKVRDAIKELAGMARMGIQPDTQAATALVDACVRAKKMEMAETVFDELFGELLVPDEVAFSVMIRGYGEEYPPQWTSIASMLSTMEHTYGVEPTVLTFNTLLEVCSKTNDEDRGAEIIERMQASGVQPNDLSFEAVRQRKSLRSLLKKLV